MVSNNPFHPEYDAPEPGDTHWHDFNPWAERIVYVPIEELAECVAGGTIHIMSENRTVPYDVDFIIQHWQRTAQIRGTPGKLDAYILPQPSGCHSLGVRYGEDGPDYFSPHNAHPEKTQALLDKYRRGGE